MDWGGADDSASVLPPRVASVDGMLCFATSLAVVVAQTNLECDEADAEIELPGPLDDASCTAWNCTDARWDVDATTSVDDELRYLRTGPANVDCAKQTSVSIPINECIFLLNLVDVDNFYGTK